jgi:fatty acid desaturase
MTHTDFLKSLTPGQRAKLIEQSNAPALIHLVLHWGMIIVFGLYIGFELPFWGILILPQGILIAFCFCLLHETVHGTPFKSNRLNTIIGTVCSYMIFLPRTWFRYFHMAHHKYTNDAENDPELNMAKPETLRQYLWYASAIPLWRGNIGKIFKNAIRRNNDPYVPPKAKPKLRTEARLMLATYLIFLILLGFGQFWLLRSWLIPLVLGQPFLRLYLLAEHGRCKLVANMFENTRTTFTSRIIRFLAWNMPYHTEHHVFPTVPFHKLPLLHQIMADKLCNTSDGYMEFHREYIETLNGATTD